MTAHLIDGKALAESVREGLRPRVEQITARRGRAPGLGVLLVGDDPASAIYVRNKERAATALGMHSRVVRLPADARLAEVMAAVDALNRDAAIDAFLVQLPLPGALAAHAATVTEAIAPAKDADGLHPVSLGRLLLDLPGPRPCTPRGILALLDHAGVDPAGKHAVVVGRSAIVGKPAAIMLLARHATVTVCHSRTADLAAEVARADIVVAAVGQRELIRGSWLKPGAAVIDVGMNRNEQGLCGDVAAAEAGSRAGWLTPVPGGVGPMTIAMLLVNTVEAAERTFNAQR